MIIKGKNKFKTLTSILVSGKLKPHRSSDQGKFSIILKLTYVYLQLDGQLKPSQYNPACIGKLLKGSQ